MWLFNLGQVLSLALSRVHYHPYFCLLCNMLVTLLYCSYTYFCPLLSFESNFQKLLSFNLKNLAIPEHAAFYPCTGIYMFIPSPSLLVILKTFSNCSFTYFDSIQAIMQIILFFHLIQKHLSLNLATCFLLSIKRDFRPNLSVLINRSWHHFQVAMYLKIILNHWPHA